MITINEIKGRISYDFIEWKKYSRRGGSFQESGSIIARNGDFKR